MAKQPSGEGKAPLVVALVFLVLLSLGLGVMVYMAGDEKAQLRDQANEYYETGRERAREWEQGLEQYVQEKPLQAVLIAAGVGVLLGLLWKRS